ncbi:MAG: hypothetical protein WBG73_02335 [Coleofasciculaceae cyanobacterium]
MKLAVVLITGIVTIIGLSVPVIAQINRPSQDFFEQGREQLEREIQILRESPNTPENPQKTPEPVLEVSPSPDMEIQPQPSPLPTPTQ